MLVLPVGILLTLIAFAWPAFKYNGLSLLFGTQWDPVFQKFGALSFILGTVFTSLLALAICLPFALSIALFLGHYFKNGIAANLLRSTLELVAGIPSVIYGFWGLFVLVPAVRNVEILLNVPPYGVGIITAALILSVMIIPYAASLSREVIALVPEELKEAAISLGATSQEVVTKVIIPYARSGIFAGVLMSLGRALGETMAVTMVIGNMIKLPTSIFDPGNTLASVLANEFAEASGQLYVSTLVELGLILFGITALFSLAGRWIIRKWAQQ